MTKWAFRVLLLMGSLASMESQQVGVQQNASIAGLVVKLGTSEAVPEAGVELRRTGGGSPKTYTVRATTEGKFTFKDIPPGEYRLAAAHAGFVRSEYGQRGPNGRGLPIALSAGQDMKDVRIALAQTGAISGHIYDRKGAPIANVQVLALKYGYRGSSRALLAVKAATTNDLGEYRLFGLPPAQYAISAMPLRGAIRDMVTEIMSDGYQISRGVSAPAGAPISAPNEESSMPFYYPGTADPELAAPINVRSADNVAAINMALATLPTRRVRGAVTNLPSAAELAAVTGTPRITASAVSVGLAPRNPNASALLVDAAPAASRASADPRSGAFEIRGVLPGSYYVYAEFAGSNTGRFGLAPVEIADQDLSDVTIALAPGFDVSFRVSIDGRLPGSEIPELARMRLWLLSSIERLRGLQAQPNQPVGSFVVHGVTPGEYRVQPEFIGVDITPKSMRLGGVDIARGFRLDGPPDNPIELVLTSNRGSGAITGTVINDKLEPTPNVTVVLVPDGSGSYKDVWTDATGRFRMTDIPPGNYTLYAWEDVERFAWQNSDFMRNYAGRGKPVHIDEGGAVNTQVNLIPYQPSN